jgi:undecaprenyl-diphosphatase
MDLVHAFILGVIQGLTEFLPVSSSGHLALVQNSIGNVDVSFDVVLHFATLLAILFYFYKDLALIIKDFFTWKTKTENFKLAWILVLASVPIALIGFFARKFIYGLFGNLWIIAIGFFISGMFLFTASFIKPQIKKNKRKDGMVGWKKGLIIGCAQALAVVPGISRSGSTVSSGLLLGIERKKAIRFSFLLAIPAMIGANILNLSDLVIIEPSSFIIGFIAAFFAGLFAIFIFIQYLNLKRFRYFAYYCWAIALGVLMMQLFA